MKAFFLVGYAYINALREMSELGSCESRRADPSRLSAPRTLGRVTQAVLSSRTASRFHIQS